MDLDIANLEVDASARDSEMEHFEAVECVFEIEDLEEEEMILMIQGKENDGRWKLA